MTTSLIPLTALKDGSKSAGSPAFCHHPESCVARRSLPGTGLKLLECTCEAVLLRVCRLGEHWLDIDDRRSINRFYRSHL
jgi:hypothetical protein